MTVPEEAACKVGTEGGRVAQVLGSFTTGLRVRSEVAPHPSDALDRLLREVVQVNPNATAVTRVCELLEVVVGDELAAAFQLGCFLLPLCECRVQVK
jgi:hypothetical protein